MKDKPRIIATFAVLIAATAVVVGMSADSFAATPTQQVTTAPSDQSTTSSGSPTSPSPQPTQSTQPTTSQQQPPTGQTSGGSNTTPQGTTTPSGSSTQPKPQTQPSSTSPSATTSPTQQSNEQPAANNDTATSQSSASEPSAPSYTALSSSPVRGSFLYRQAAAAQAVGGASGVNYGSSRISPEAATTMYRVAAIVGVAGFILYAVSALRRKPAWSDGSLHPLSSRSLNQPH